MQNKHQQKKTHSLVEAVFNTAIGLGVNVLAQHFIFPFFGIYISWSTNFGIAFVFTFISIARGYLIRRFFTKRT